MKRTRACVAGALLIVGAAALLPRCCGPNGPAPPLPRPESPQPVAPPRWLGMTSCAVAGCHGGNGKPGQHNSEFTTWQAMDPHARAFEVLQEPPAQLMVRRLLGDGAAQPDKQRLCLACHDAAGRDDTPRAPHVTGGLGVACEACHGPAELWRQPHAEVDWRSRDVGEKVGLGMANIWDAGARARLCARCHVGDGGVAVNHDLIAAGHPALFFELASHMGRLPRHWQQDRGVDGRPLAASELWTAGQLETARAALLVLVNQARDPESPWPEFAQLQCAICHHELTDGGGGRPEGRGQASGLLRPADWYAATLEPVLAEQSAPAFRFPEFVKKLRRLELQLARLSSDRQEVAVLARDLAEGLPSQVIVPTEPWGLVTRLAQWDPDHPLRRQDAAQRFLALSAWAGTLPDADAGRRDDLNDAFRRLRGALGKHASVGLRRALEGNGPFDAKGALDALEDIVHRARPRTN